MKKIKLFKNIYLIHSEFFDFLASLFRVNNNEKRIGDMGRLKFDNEIQKWVESARNLIPENINKEIKLFFDYETFYGMCLIPEFIDHDNITIEDAIDSIEKCSPLKILEIFMSTGYNLDGEENIEDLVRELAEDNKKAAEYINNKLSISSECKWELLQFFMDPDNMKKELIELLRWYYENIYKYILETAEKATKKYEKYFVKQVSIYGKDYLKVLNPASFKSDNKTVISFSYFYEFAQLHHTDNNLTFYMTGLRYAETHSEDKSTVSPNVQMFKALSDETRLNILKLLYERKWYGKELALKLGLSNSTVSYHLSMLSINGFISEEVSDNKIFYTFSKENMKKILCDSIDEFFV